MVDPPAVEAPSSQDSRPGASPPFPLPSAAQAISGVLQAVLVIGYPIAIYYAHSRLSTRQVALLVFVFVTGSLLLRVRAAGGQVAALVKQHLPIAALILLAVLLDNRLFLLFLPTLLSLVLLYTFGASLVTGPPMIERFARIIEDDLPDFTLSYCRKVTWMWCGFFAWNALCIGVLAVSAPVSWWAVYTGLVFYVLLGTLLAGEFVFRKVWFRYYTGGPVDRLLERWFPPAATERGRRSLAYRPEASLDPEGRIG